MSVEYGIITSVVPPGSWHYVQELSSGQTVKITGHSFEQLLESMVDFRRRHLELCGGSENSTIEKVRFDLKAYFCKYFPQNCADARGNVPAAGIGVSATYRRPIDRAANWLGELGSFVLERVDPALAAQRAHICAQCPMNVRWQSPCAPCNENVLVRVQNAKGSAYTPYDKHLFMCRAYGHHNEVAVWLADTHSSPEHEPPAHCWLKGGPSGQ